MMNKLIFSLFLAILFASCQNTPKAAADAPLQSPVAPAPPPASPEQLQQATASLTTGLKMMEELRAKVDALPAKIKKEKAKDIEGIYGSFEGLMAKQGKMLEELKGASAPAGAGQESSEVAAVAKGITAAQIQEYNEAAARYAKEAQGIQEMVDSWTAGKK